MTIVVRFKALKGDIELARRWLSVLKKQRQEHDKLGKVISSSQDELILLFEKLNAEKRGIRFTLEGEEFAAVVTRSKPAPVYDTAALVAYLRNTGQWRNVSSRVLDMRKLKEAVERGEIDQKVLDKFIAERTQRAPYIRFTDPKEGNL